MSSISRAFTLRSKRTRDRESSAPSRPASMRFLPKPVDVRTISSPLALLSTTNMLSYNAPDVSSVRAQRKASTSVSSASSRSSADESDTSTISHTSHRSTSTDISSISSSPIPSPETKDRLSCFPSSKSSSLSPPIPLRLSRSISSSELRPRSSLMLGSEPGFSPEIPERAPSHSKKAHEALARKRSLQTMSRASSVSSIQSTSRERRNSFEFFNKDVIDAAAPSLTTSASSPASSLSNSPHTSHNQSPQSHPFGKELMQLDEIAEEYGGAVRDAEREGDVRAMRQRGLQHFCAEEYMREIQVLTAGFVSSYPSHVQQQEVAWI